MFNVGIENFKKDFYVNLVISGKSWPITDKNSFRPHIGVFYKILKDSINIMSN